MFEFRVENMTCASCAGVITKAIKTVDPNVHVNVEVASQRVFVRSERSERELADLIEECGYPVLNASSVYESAEKGERS
ncbi:heavy-metal-associated domain-containing protein [Leptospira ellisii]|uniref:Copper-binding protein n=1 Tax=Leptospira ellisii TaxID=2023197 RepID=A0A2N0BCJ3_9LEPT|nr:heavy-metal-associated domain-containing protein [Leptospira ellisii]MDV6235992.1 heavy-metal-associated domain-containing protein [Leptospira ellisii]PJZ94268.1 copper-binding protein [Leptospira ellisii]PKA05560.1 copper-binding protein [Leptospira ellisii]